MTPVAESLIADVFRQAMREVLYEDELDARARQQRALYLRRTMEEIEKQRLEHEDERLNKVIVSIQFQSFHNKYRKIIFPPLSNAFNIIQTFHPYIDSKFTPPPPQYLKIQNCVNQNKRFIAEVI